MTRIHFIIVGCVCAAAVFGYFAWYAQVAGESAKAATLAGEVTNQDSNVLHQSLLTSALAELGGDKTLIDNAFVSDSTIVSFLGSLEASATSTGAQVSILSVGAAKDASVPSIQITVSITGTFDQVARAVGIIEYAPYALTSTNLVLASAGTKTWGATYTVLVQEAPGGSSAAKPTSTATSSTP